MARATAVGITAPLARRLPRAARPCPRGAAPEATDVPTSCRTAATGAAVEPARADLAFRRPGTGCGGWPGLTIWHVRSKRSEAQRSAAWRPARAAGQFVAPLERRAVQRQGWKPVRGETRTAGTGLDAKHNSLTPRSGDAPRIATISEASIVPDPFGDTRDLYRRSPTRGEPRRRHCGLPTWRDLVELPGCMGAPLLEMTPVSSSRAPTAKRSKYRRKSNNGRGKSFIQHHRALRGR